MPFVVSRGRVVALVGSLLLVPAWSLAAETAPRPTVKITGEVTISFGPDGSMTIKASEGAVTTVDYSGAAPAKPLVKKTAAPAEPKVVQRTPVALDDRPIATSPARRGPVQLASLSTSAADAEGAGKLAVEKDPKESDPKPPETEQDTVTTEKTTEKTDTNGNTTTETTKETVKTTIEKKNSDAVASIYAGTGAIVTRNLGSKRADKINFYTRKDGEIFAQVQKSEDVDISVAVETHYLLKNQSLFTRGDDEPAWSFLGKILACGPFVLATERSGQVVGCGPLFTAVLDSDAKIDQFGIGWALGLGKKEGSPDRADFGVGVGLLFDPDSKVVDKRVIDTDTMLVRSSYRDAVIAGAMGGDGAISALVSRPSTSAFIMVSKTF